MDNADLADLLNQQITEEGGTIMDYIEKLIGKVDKQIQDGSLDVSQLIIGNKRNSKDSKGNKIQGASNKSLTKFDT